MYCAVTGETKCKCADPKPKVNDIDLKSALRKLFTDHGVFTKFVANAIVDGTQDVDALVPRLLQNQIDIGNQLKPIVGVEKGKKASVLLMRHIELAAEVIKAAKGKSSTLNDQIAKLFSNSEEIAKFLTSLNPKKLPYSATKSMFDMHNQFVIDMTVARLSKEFQKEIKLYDAYYNELLQMSDSIYNAL